MFIRMWTASVVEERGRQEPPDLELVEDRVAVGGEQVVERAGADELLGEKTATLIGMIALQAGAAPESHPEPRVLSR